MAEQLYKNGMKAEAISQLDAVGDRLMEAGDKVGVAVVIKQILEMDPPNAEEYRNLLAQL